jgi:hypothetical protein
MASPVYQTVSGNSGTAASFTATEPTGAASGDGLLLFVFSDTNPSGFTPPAGWNLEISQTVTDGTNTFQARIYSIRRGGSAPALGASWTGSLYFEWTIVRISGIVASGSFVEVLTSATSGSGSAPDSPSATPLTANTLALSTVWSWAGFTGSQAVPTGYTSIRQVLNTGNAQAFKTLSTTAAENPSAWGSGTTSAIWANTLIIASQAASAPNTDQVPLQAAFPAPRPTTLVRRAQDAAAPVGTLLVAAGLSSIGWGPVTPQPCVAAVGASSPRPEVAAPIGIGTFALTKFSHSAATPLPPRPNAPNRPAPLSSEPVGALLTPSQSVGWFYYDEPGGVPRKLVISGSAGDEFPRLTTALSSYGWAAGADPQSRPATARTAPQAEQPTSPLTPFVSASTGWLSAECQAPALRPPRPEPAQPIGPLVPFVSLSIGWLTVELPLDTPLARRVVSESGPTGTLLTPQPFGWNTSEQARPAPQAFRRPLSAEPVGTPFAIALPSNGWLATENPRSPLRLGRSTPTDPVGNLLVLPLLPSLAWLATDNPRTPYVTHRDPPNDPVGTAFPFLAKLGPYWYADLPAKAPPPGPRLQSSEPVGAAIASALISVGWFAPPPGTQAAVRAQRPQPTDPLSALQFGGTPWADITTSQTRLAAPARLLSAEPVGSPLSAVSLPSIGWLATDAPRGSRWRATQLEPSQQLALLTPAGLISLGWLTADTIRPAATKPVTVLSVEPVGARLSTLLSLGWQAAEVPRPQHGRPSQPEPTLPLAPLAFGGAPWGDISLRAPPAKPPRVAISEPVGAFIPPPGPSPSVAWMSVAPIPPQPQRFAPMAVEIASVAAYPARHQAARGPVLVVSITDESRHVIVASVVDEGIQIRVTSIKVED